MLIDNLKKIVKNGKNENLSAEYIKIELKEKLILFTLNFIYNSSKWSKLVFSGGTALKMIGKTARLSEDLDMDYMENEFDYKDFVKDLLSYFEGLGLVNITTSIKQEGKIITLKFPVLKELGLITNIKNQSNLLHLKIELEKNKYSQFKIKTIPFISNNLFFVIKSYDLETLFSNKIGAILGRRNKIYHHKYDFKGRDFYDLIWFMQNGIKPNIKRAKQIIKAEQDKKISSYDDIWDLIRQRISNIDTKGIYKDIKNLVKEPESARQLAGNFLDIYEGLVKDIS